MGREETDLVLEVILLELRAHSHAIAVLRRRRIRQRTAAARSGVRLCEDARDRLLEELLRVAKIMMTQHEDSASVLIASARRSVLVPMQVCRQDPACDSRAESPRPKASARFTRADE